jgi:antitoxin component YwqK of YwqJK toxin-antitoxin module
MTTYSKIMTVIFWLFFMGTSYAENCKGDLKDGKKQGLWKCYYDDGKLQQEGNYENDKKEGVWKLYHSNGKLAAEGTYKADQEKGKWRFYDDNGTLLFEEDRG